MDRKKNNGMTNQWTENALGIIYRAVDEINQFRSEDIKLEKSPHTPLFGNEGRLDSLAAVNFIVAAEMAAEEEYNVHLNLADERAMSMAESPFRTIGTLAEYLAGLLEEQANGNQSI